MAAIGRALDDLSDPAARQRVLKWAAERFAVEGVVEPAAPAAVAAAGSDPDLAVDSLNDMFVDGVEQFDDDLGEFAGPSPVVHVAETKKLPLESVLKSFADDFRRLADEWNGAAASL